jgi:crossover junction endodeoxyribonuclease RusA
MKALTLTIPVPPSLNNAYATVHGRRVLSERGREFKKRAGTLAKLAARSARFTVGKDARLSLTLFLYFGSKRRRDISNTVKLCEDALGEYLGFDDCAVDVLHVERKENDKANPRCLVVLEVL